MSQTFGVPDRVRVWILMRKWTGWINRDKPLLKWTNTFFPKTAALAIEPRTLCRAEQGHQDLLQARTPMRLGSRRNLQSLAGVRRSSTIWGICFPQNITFSWATDKLLLAADPEPGFPPFLITSRAAQANLRSLAKRGEAVLCSASNPSSPEAGVLLGFFFPPI